MRVIEDVDIIQSAHLNWRVYWSPCFQPHIQLLEILYKVPSLEVLTISSVYDSFITFVMRVIEDVDIIQSAHLNWRVYWSPCFQPHIQLLEILYKVPSLEVLTISSVYDSFITFVVMVIEDVDIVQSVHLNWRVYWSPCFQPHIQQFVISRMESDEMDVMKKKLIKWYKADFLHFKLAPLKTSW